MNAELRPPLDKSVEQTSYCSTRIAAQQLGVSLGTVQHMVESGRLQAWKTVGGHRRILIESIERMLDERRHALGEPSRQMRVVIVEDDPITQAVYKAALEKWALPIDWELAADGFAGLLSIGRARTDLLITDLLMPGMDGFEMIRRLRAQQGLDAMDIVVVSGLMDEEIEAHGGLPPGVVRLNKPVPLAELKAYLQGSATASARHIGS